MSLGSYEDLTTDILKDDGDFRLFAKRETNRGTRLSCLYTTPTDRLTEVEMLQVRGMATAGFKTT